MELSKVFGAIELANPSDRTFTINDDTPFYIGIQCNSTTTFTNTSFEIMLNEGSTTVNFIPYYNYELCKIGDNSDLIFKNEPNNPNYNNTLIENAWYKKNCIKKQRFQNKSFNFSAYWTGDVVSYAYVGYGKSTLKCTDMLFTHFEKVANRSSVGFFLLDAVLYLNFNKDILGVTTENTYTEHTEALENFFTNNDVQFMYDTTEITYTQITEETLINQLESLYRTIIQVPTIIIETESDEDNAQLIVNASALKSSEDNEN